MKFVIHSLIFLCIGIGLLYAYLNYESDIKAALFTEPDTHQIFIDTVALSVSVADSPEERRAGLSGTPPLNELEGKLFIFNEPDTYGIWMKDMNYPIDIIWIDEHLRIVHIVEGATPDSYPTVFKPPVPALYVLETASSFVSTYKIAIGNTLTFPPSL